MHVCSKGVPELFFLLTCIYPLCILYLFVAGVPQWLCGLNVILAAWHAQVMAAENAGAAAAIIINTEDRLMPMGDDAEHKPSIPSIHLPLSGGQALRDALKANSDDLKATLRPSHASLDSSSDTSASAAGPAECPMAEDQKELSDTMGMVHAAGSQACHDSRKSLQGQGWCAAGQIEPAKPSTGGVEFIEDSKCELSDSAVQMPNEAKGHRDVRTAPSSRAQREAQFQAAEAQLHAFNSGEPGRPGPHMRLGLCMHSESFIVCL